VQAPRAVLLQQRRLSPDKRIMPASQPRISSAREQILRPVRTHDPAFIVWRVSRRARPVNAAYRTLGPHPRGNLALASPIAE
jgi:hypothetical protein